MVIKLLAAHILDFKKQVYSFVGKGGDFFSARAVLGCSDLFLVVGELAGKGFLEEGFFDRL